MEIRRTFCGFPSAIACKVGCRNHHRVRFEAPCCFWLWGSIGIMEKKMDTIGINEVICRGYRETMIWSLFFLQQAQHVFSSFQPVTGKLHQTVLDESCAAIPSPNSSPAPINTNIVPEYIH